MDIVQVALSRTLSQTLVEVLKALLWSLGDEASADLDTAHGLSFKISLLSLGYSDASPPPSQVPNTGSFPGLY